MAALSSFFLPQFTMVASGAVVPNAAGKVFTYVAGTNTLKTTYKDTAGAVAHTNPIILDADGFPPGGEIYFGTGTYDVAVQDSAGVPLRTFANVNAAETAGAGQAAADGVLADLAADDGATLVMDKKPFTDTIARTQHSINADSVYLTDFPDCDKTGATDSSGALLAALASGAKRVVAPAGVYLFTQQLTVPEFVTFEGEGYGTLSGTGSTRLLKRGNFNGIVVQGGAQLRSMSIEGDTGNGGDGIHVLGGRSVVSDVSVFLMGRDGIKVGDYTASSANTNLWRLTNALSRSNVRHGIFIAHEGAGTSTNCNAGIALGIDTSNNGADGVLIQEAYDNALYGLCSQSNTGWGWRLESGAWGNFIDHPYTEANGQGDGGIEVGADRNTIDGFRAGQNNDGYVDNGTDNRIIGRYGSVNSAPFHKSAEAFAIVRFMEKTTSGYWDFKKDATTRNLSVSLNSSASADILVQNTGGGAAGIRFSTATDSGAIRAVLRKAQSLNFGSIAVNSSVDVTVTLTGADSTYTYQASAVHAIPAGISVNCYWDASASAVKVRCLNVTGAAVTVNGAFNILAIKAV